VEDQAQSHAESGDGHGHPRFSWTSIFTGHFFDYGLDTELLGLDIKGKKGLLFDKLAATKNKVLLVQSFRVTQVRVLEIVNGLLGKGQGLKTRKASSREFVKERIEGAAKGEEEATEEMVAVLGIKRSDWKGDSALANEVLGIKEEDLEDVIKRALKQMGEI
jgi:hypothetical protein